MPDVYLFGNESNPSDVRLREAGAPAPATHTVEVAVSAVAVAAVNTLLIPVVQPPAVGGGGRPVFIRPAPVLLRREVGVQAVAWGSAAVELDVDHVGRRQQEDELVLVGAI